LWSVFRIRTNDRRNTDGEICGLGINPAGEKDHARLSDSAIAFLDWTHNAVPETRRDFSVESEGKLYVFRRIYSRIVPDYSIEIA
jgi:hypothetical protein